MHSISANSTRLDCLTKAELCQSCCSGSIIKGIKLEVAFRRIDYS